ncbi:SDR family NAD(P)-dependent oxidoreductase [Actinomadura rugatobispora]|uniref:SDR family NAD(P)-dependent oxidoreductase n=1 Tax=Actinomadura rugatobispora TaxID=1994 RepID=A0ABW1A8V5_9ACTN|nr:hypothetical protein GCM10010200_012700 [Actinomadura rugatobispora]
MTAEGGAGGIIGISPFGRPAPHLTVAVARAGAIGVLDLGTDRAAALAALADVGRWWRGAFGVRVPAGCGVRPRDLPDAVDTVLIDFPALRPEAPRPAEVEAPAPAESTMPMPAVSPDPAADVYQDEDDGGWTVRTIPPPPPASDRGAHGEYEFRPVEGGEGDDDDAEGLIDPRAFAAGGRRRLLIEVVNPEEATEAVRRLGPLAAARPGHGLVARGCEGGGRVGELSTFVLLQRLLGDARIGLPVWAAGGIGPHTAAAAVAGGAAGVVLDSQLALVRETDLPADVAAAVAAMDGSETRIVEGHRVYARPDLPRIELAGLDLAGMNARMGATGLRSRLLPVGQDGALARPLAERHRTAGGVVQAVRAQIAAGIRAAVRTEPLASRGASGPGAEEASGAGTGREYPVAQGPMTRVSDRSAFAAAVAQDGGLPFLALALMSGDETRDLLRDTAERLGERPWGVGVLGFAPPEVREAQLAAVRAVRPPYALVAGGRPAQVEPLESVGIRTYLHVPSPGLLDRFLAEGARRFVFEGSECGGHVGPRASFPLWEAQVQRLLAYCDAHEGAAAGLSVMFAGGIHDERSAAMVAALAGPLAERGVGIRLLMGTAYLFTYEAVAAGAITPGFQRAAIECDGTALLETSPGHATRCARTPYVAAFEERRRLLEEAGTPRQEVWRLLEELNLGRLRIASKGLRREPGRGPLAGAGGAAEPGGLVPVGADEQRAEGMFMLGQAAALRWSTTSITGLHEQVSTGATFFLATRAATLGLAGAGAESARARGAAGAAEAATGASGASAEGAAGEPMDIAIVGIGCVFPGAADSAAFWANVVRGVDSISEVPPDRWDPDVYFDPAALREDAGAGAKTPSKWGGFIPDVPFDALAYGIPPASLGSVEPMQLLGLEVAARALRDAGYADRPFDRSRTSVFFGAEAGTDLGNAYGARALLPMYYGQVPPGLDEQLPRLTEDSCPGVLTNVIAGRIANRLDLGGANYTVDAACAASLAALDAACKELVAGGSDMVLCGGADLHNGIYDYLLFSAVRALSPRGRCAPFDAAADGIALGEGVGCVALKRLADAERDGDRIYAVIKSVAAASDGRSAGITAPRAEGQRRALERAYRRAGVSPSRVGLVEAHGTGTEVGDRVELATLTETFTGAGARPGGTALGSVKSQIGHTKCAAGLAGLIKTAYALHTGVLPGTLHLERPNPSWDAATSPFAFGRTTRPWAAAPGERYAGLSAFGFGGANFHAVLAGYDGAPEPVSGVAEWPAELFLIRGADQAEAGAELDRLEALLTDGTASASGGGQGRVRLRDLARTFAEREGPVRAALVATGPDDLRDKIAAAREFRAAPGVRVADEDGAVAGGRVAFLYPGQGSQRPHMLADLFVTFPRLQRLLRLAGGRYAGAMFPPAAFTPEEAERQRLALTDTRVAQPALGIAGLAVHRLLTALGVRPDLAAGHSYGELVALCAAGVFGEEDLIGLSAARAEAILAAAGVRVGTGAGGDAGAMAAVAARLEDVRAALDGVGEVVVANHNAPRQVVISGSSPGIEQALAALGERGIAGRRLPVACAFHSPLVAGAAAALRAELHSRDLRSPAYPVWSNSGAAPYDTDPDRLRATLAGQVAVPVRFVEQIEAMYAAGARIFVEAGPGRVLTQLTGKILGDRPHTAVAVDVPGEEGVERLLTALADLAVAGVPVDPLPLFAGRDARPLPSAGAVPSTGRSTGPGTGPGWIVNGHLVRTADGGHLDNGLRPAERIAPPLAGVPQGETMDSGQNVSAPPQPGGARTASVPPPSPAPSVPAASSAPSGASEEAAEGEAAVLEFLRSGREIIAAQREVVLNYLAGEQRPGGGAVPRPPLPARSRAPRPLPVPVPGPRRAMPGEAVSASSGAGTTGANGAEPEPEARPAAPGPADIRSGARNVGEAVAGGSGGASPQNDADIRSTVLEVIGSRTGYPEGMLAVELDLEADLSIDSIKRTEIIGELAERVGLAPAGTRLDETVAERLARIKTIAELVAWIGERLAGRTDPAPDPVQESAPPPAAVEGTATLRHVVRMTELPEPPPGFPDAAGRFAGRTFVIVDDGCGIALELAALLEDQGAHVRTPREPDGPCDGLIHLGSLQPGGGPVLPGAYAPIRAALVGGLRWLVLAGGTGGTFARRYDGGDAGDPTPGTGLRGLARTLAREFPETLVRALDVNTKETPRAIALRVLAEMADAEAPVDVGHDGEVRRTLTVVPAELPLPAAALGPDGRPALGLDANSVVLLTGGARGITAKVALELARTTGCHIELAGRTPLPGAEPAGPPPAEAHDEAALRRFLVARGGNRTPAEIEAEIRRILAAREVAATLEALREHAASVRYQTLDVREAQAVRALVEDVYARHGRLDGVVHGAGLVDDRLVRHKDPASFDRVYRTKVDGASALAASVRPDLGFFVVFGSVSGVRGNRGQADYAAANDACDTLAHAWRTRLRGRVLVADWGPWAGGGMVTPELAREYSRRGVPLIDPDAGVAALLREIVHGDEVQVVFTGVPS